MDKLPEAQSAWVKALEIDPGYDEARLNLERLREMVKDER
jgi:hypothetical protein